MEYTNAIVYTNDKTQIVFLKDADIVNDMSANTISGNSVLSNGIPSYDLFRKHYNLVSADISAISDDVEYLKDVEKKAVVYHTTLLSTDTTTNNRLTSFLQDNFHDVNYMFKQSWMYHLSAAQTLKDDNLVEKYIGENDYILFNKNKKLSEVLFEDLDIIRDSYTEVLSLKIYCDNNLCNAISSLSTALSTDINSLSTSLSDVTRLSVENLQKQVISNDNDIEFLSGVVEDKISADLYELSDNVYETSSFLSDQVKSLWDDVRGGVNYKGHLSANSTSQFPDGTNYALSTIFASYYDLMNDAKELTADKVLNNGWLYNFTTDDASGFTTKDGVSLENNDYIIIHKHGADSLSVSEIVRGNVDIIEAVQNDYVRFALLNAVSTALSTDYVGKISDLSDSISNITRLSVENLQKQVISNDSDISFLSGEAKRLSTELSNNIDSLSGALSTDISSICVDLQLQIQSNDNDIADLSAEVSTKLWLKDPDVYALKDGTYTDLSVVKLPINEYNEKSAAGELDPRALYIVSADYVETYGQVISNMTMTADPTASEAASQHYVDVIKGNVELSVTNLCTEISANDIDIADLQEKQLSIDTRYISTFTTRDKVANPHISSDNLVLTDPDGHLGAGTEHKQYYVSFESGTLVLKPLNF